MVKIVKKLLLYAFWPKKIHKNIKVEKNGKKSRGGAQKLSQSCQKMRKFDKKLVLYAFWHKKLHKNTSVDVGSAMWW